MPFYIVQPYRSGPNRFHNGDHRALVRALTSERSVSPCVGERVPAFLGAAERDYSGRSHV
jgi:hypothetical protein